MVTVEQIQGVGSLIRRSEPDALMKRIFEVLGSLTAADRTSMAFYLAELREAKHQGGVAAPHLGYTGCSVLHLPVLRLVSSNNNVDCHGEREA